STACCTATTTASIGRRTSPIICASTTGRSTRTVACSVLGGEDLFEREGPRDETLLVQIADQGLELAAVPLQPVGVDIGGQTAGLFLQQPIHPGRADVGVVALHDAERQRLRLLERAQQAARNPGMPFDDLTPNAERVID